MESLRECIYFEQLILLHPQVPVAPRYKQSLSCHQLSLNSGSAFEACRLFITQLEAQGPRTCNES